MLTQRADHYWPSVSCQCMHEPILRLGANQVVAVYPQGTKTRTVTAVVHDYRNRISISADSSDFYETDSTVQDTN